MPKNLTLSSLGATISNYWKSFEDNFLVPIPGRNNGNSKENKVEKDESALFFNSEDKKGLIEEKKLDNSILFPIDKKSTLLLEKSQP